MKTLRTRILFLDILRAIACALVIVNHLHIPESYTILHSISRGGWCGVDLFFVLSGFLVSGVLFQEFRANQSVDLRRFLIRRGLKIYPAFYAFLFSTAIGIHLFGRDASFASVRHLLAEVFFVQNYFPGFWAHTWSLAVEEHFYFGIAIVVALVAWSRFKLSSQVITVLMLIIAVISLLLRWRLSSVPYDARTHLFPTHLRMDSLGFGVLLSHAWHFHQEYVRKLFYAWRWVLLAFGTVGSLPAFLYERQDTPWLCVFGLTLLYIANGSLLLGLCLVRIPESGVVRVLAAVGAQSYSIYLWHEPVVSCLVPRLHVPLGGVHPLLPAAIGFVVSIALGMVMAQLIEVPVLALRDRWTASRWQQRQPVNAVPTRLIQAEDVQTSSP